jgi:hypothetical protein
LEKGEKYEFFKERGSEKQPESDIIHTGLEAAVCARLEETVYASLKKARSALKPLI